MHVSVGLSPARFREKWAESTASRWGSGRGHAVSQRASDSGAVISVNAPAAVCVQPCVLPRNLHFRQRHWSIVIYIFLTMSALATDKKIYFFNAIWSSEKRSGLFTKKSYFIKKKRNWIKIQEQDWTEFVFFLYWIHEIIRFKLLIWRLSLFLDLSGW